MLRLGPLALLTISLASGTATPAPDDSEKGKLTTETLKALLDDMGLAPKEVEKGLYRITSTRSDYTVPIRFKISGDGRTIYLSTLGGMIERPAEMPARFWKRLLVENDKLSSTGTFWMFSKTDRVPALVRALPNARLTSAKWRREINSFHDLVNKNREVWEAKDSAFVPIFDSPSEAKERARLQGRWEAVVVVNAGTKLTREQIEKETKGKGVEIVLGNPSGSIRLAQTNKFVARMGEAGQMAIYLGDQRSLMPTRFTLDKDTLILCWDANGMEYPRMLESTKANGFHRLELKRAGK